MTDSFQLGDGSHNMHVEIMRQLGHSDEEIMADLANSGIEIIDPVTDLDDDARMGLMLFNILPDKIEGMSGTWLGKDFTGLDDIFDIYEIVDRREVFEYLLVCIEVAREQYAIKQKSERTAQSNKDIKWQQ